MIDSFVKFIQGVVRLKGDTDGTFIGNINDSLKVNNGSSFDAFGRNRVSLPIAMYDATFFTDISDIAFSKSVANSATIAHDNTKKAMILTCSTTTNSRAIMQSKQYVPYHPAKSNIIIFTANFKGLVANVDKYIGQYDTNNGFYFLANGTTFKVGVRSKITGSVVNNEIAQSSWNLDKLDGTGTSGKTIDLSKQIIFYFEYQWLGAGSVKFGVVIDGVFIPCHVFHHSNILTTLYSQTATLPIRTEIINNATTSSTLELTCMSVTSEGYTFNGGILRSATTGTTYRYNAGSGANFPLISIRKKSAFVTVPLKVESAGIFMPTANEALVQFAIGGTLTGGSWVDGGGVAEYNSTATAITGQRILASGYMKGGSGSNIFDLASKIDQTLEKTLGTNLDGTSELFTLLVSNITNNISYGGYFDYREIL